MPVYSRGQILARRPIASGDGRSFSRDEILARPQSPLVGPVVDDDRDGLLIQRHGGKGAPALFTMNQLTGVRSSEAAYWDPRAGQFAASAWLSNDQLRIFSDGAALFEEARTNYVQQSNDLSAWSSGGGITVAAVPGAAPDGGVAYSAEDDSTALQYLLLNATAPPLGTITVSAFFERNSTGWPGIQVRDDGLGSITGGTAAVHVDTTNGLAAAQSGSPTNILVEEAGPNWYRLSFNLEVTTSGAFPMRLYGAFGTVLGTASASATGECMIWGVQMEAGEWPTSPIRTSGAAATRAAEKGILPSASVPATMLSDGFSVLTVPLFDSDSTSGRFLFQMGSAGNQLEKSSTVPERHRVRSGGSAAVGDTATGYVGGDEVRFILEWGADLEIEINGVADASSPYNISSLSAWALGDLAVGNEVSGLTAPWSGVIHPPVAV